MAFQNQLAGQCVYPFPAAQPEGQADRIMGAWGCPRCKTGLGFNGRRQFDFKTALKGEGVHWVRTIRGHGVPIGFGPKILHIEILHFIRIQGLECNAVNFQNHHLTFQFIIILLWFHLIEILLVILPFFIL